MSGDSFIRKLEIRTLESTAETLELSQKVIGDVNCVVWDASIALAKYLEKQTMQNANFLAKKQVIELGSGVGCVGLCAALLGAQVALTDLPNAINITKENAETNRKLISSYGGSIAVQILHWGAITLDFQNKTFDKVLLADCVYYLESIDDLVKTLDELSSENTDILQAQEIRESELQRNVWKMYLEKVQKYFTVTFVPREDQSEEHFCEEIKILRLRKK